MPIPDKYIQILAKNKLFDGIPISGAAVFLACADARAVNYKKNEEIISEHSVVKDIGVLMSGLAFATKLEAGGKRVIISRLEKGSIFGDVLSGASKIKSPVTVTAMSAAAAVLIPFKKAVLQGENPWRERFLLNVVDILSEKYFALQERVSCIIRPTLRDKILFYLNSVSTANDGEMFTIPFGRDELADYLNADRSALSRELSAMKKDGLIDYHKNSFRLTE